LAALRLGVEAQQQPAWVKVVELTAEQRRALLKVAVISEVQNGLRPICVCSDVITHPNNQAIDSAKTYRGGATEESFSIDAMCVAPRPRQLYHL
jgi:hypothetical protein